MARQAAMKAIVQDAYGSADVLRLAEIERPDVADHEVLYTSSRPMWIGALGIS